MERIQKHEQFELARKPNVWVIPPSPIFDVLFLYEKRSDFEIAIKQTNNRKDLEKQIIHDTTASVHPQD